MDMMLAGVEPRSCYALYAILKEIIRKNLNTAAEDMKLRVPMSAYVHCAPGAFGYRSWHKSDQALVPERFKHLLKPGQIHLLSSTENLAQPSQGLGRTIGVNKALVTRYPCTVRQKSPWNRYDLHSAEHLLVTV